MWKKPKVGSFLLLISGITLLLGLVYNSPISQDPSYHNFSDQMAIWRIPNGWNVLSNVPFLIVGIWGLTKLQEFRSPVRMSYAIFCAGVALVSLGSGYYHLWPGDETLVWDRLPMTVAFMALFSLVTGEFVNIRLGRLLLPPLLVLGLFSIGYWVYYNDLWLYALVQFYPMLAIPIILIFYRSDRSTGPYWWMLAFYLVAKVFEFLDFLIHSFAGYLSGHSLKHLAAAGGVFIFLMFQKNRKPIYGK